MQPYFWKVMMNPTPIKLRIISTNKDVIVLSNNKVKHRMIRHRCQYVSTVADAFRKDSIARGNNSAVTPFPWDFSGSFPLVVSFFIDIGVGRGTLWYQTPLVHFLVFFMCSLCRHFRTSLSIFYRLSQSFWHTHWLFNNPEEKHKCNLGSSKLWNSGLTMDLA